MTDPVDQLRSLALFGDLSEAQAAEKLEKERWERERITAS